jgi:hypothetical protein
MGDLIMHVRRTRNLFAALGLIISGALAGLLACGQRPTTQSPSDLSNIGTVSGRLIKGPVNGATVTVYHLDGYRRGAAVGSATTDATGAFRVGVGTTTGPYLVVATAGSFVDEATGVTVPVNSAELTALVPAFDVETHLEGLAITPVSHLEAGLALYWVQAEGQTLAAADAEAWRHISAHFGALDWRTVAPTDVTAATGALLDDATKAGLLLAAFSMEARLLAEADGLTPGGRVNSLTLVEALYDDVTADGFFDGAALGGRAIILPAGGTLSDAGPTATQLDGQALRTAYAQGIAKFLASDRNVTRVSLTDAQQLIGALASNDDKRIFRAAAAAADIEPPVVTWVKPAADNAGVRGTVQLEVRALDNVAVKSFAFTAPSALVGASATPSADGKTFVLTGTLDVSPLPDGPVTISVTATDSSNNQTTSTRTIVVSNHGPTITVSTPGDGTTVKGGLFVQANAVAQAGTLTKLELRAPPPGFSTAADGGIAADTLPAADAFGAVWNTLLAPEGLTTLVVHAEDSLGGFADTSVTVNVDNIPLGTVHTVVTLGAPVSGLAVQLVAIDPATGLPVLGRPGGAVLGQTPAGVLTDANGAATFTLQQENYTGPVQLVASGASATYVDPTEPNTVIALPSSSFTLSSYVASYTTGSALDVPVNGWTTLADSAALAYALGKNPSSSATRTITAAMAVTDPLFPAHLTRPTSWALRTVYPASLTTGSQSLRDVVFAALPDVALNQLARDIALDVGLTPGAGYGAPQLLTALKQDLTDGVFDGRYGSVTLVTGGATPYTLDPNTTRFRLAIAMDQFVRGSTNKTGLGRPDLQTSGIDDNVCGDTSILYPVGSTTIPFDSTPPTVAFTITFTNGTQSGASPVGASKLVAGALAVIANASDSSGVQSLTLAANGQPLAAAPASTTGHFVASFDTKSLADGTLTFTATACDRLANCGPVTTTVTVDNTAPVITTTKPTNLSAYCSGPFDVDQAATDNYQLASFVPVPAATATSFDDQDAALARVYVPASAWLIGAAQADGDFTVGSKACDAVGNCTPSSLKVKLDRTPPTVSNVASATSLWATNSAPFRIIATIADTGSGLAQAWARVTAPGGAYADKAGSCVGSACTFDVPLATQGINNIAIWGVDSAIATPNGSPTAAGAQTVSVIYDTTPPSFAPVPNAGHYYSEQGITVATASGVPVMPVQYQYGAVVPLLDTGGAATTLPTTLYKMRSKGGAGDDNVPYLTYSLPRDSAGAANLTPTWTLRYADGSTPTGVATSGAMRTSGTSSPSFDAFDLPITPGVSGTLVYKLTATDAAGNTGTHSVTLTYQYVAGPLVITAGTTWSPDLYSYANYFGATTRTQKWTVYNPNAEPVLVSFDSPNWATPQWTETWSTIDTPFLNSTISNFTYDGQTYAKTLWWFADATLPTSAAAGHSKWECGNQNSVDAPCTDPLTCSWKGARCYGIYEGYPCTIGSGAIPRHYVGNSDATTYWSCDDPSTINHSNVFGGVTFASDFAPSSALVAYANALPAGGETTPAATATWVSSATNAAKSGWLVPAAPSVNSASATAVYATLTLPTRTVVADHTQLAGGLARDLHPIPPAGSLAFRYHRDMYMTPVYRWFAAGHCTTWACFGSVDPCVAPRCTAGRDVNGSGDVTLYYNTEYHMAYHDDALYHLVISQGLATPSTITTAPCLANGDCSAPSVLGSNAQAPTVSFGVSANLYPSLPAGAGSGPF